MMTDRAILERLVEAARNSLRGMSITQGTNEEDLAMATDKADAHLRATGEEQPERWAQEEIDAAKAWASETREKLGWKQPTVHSPEISSKCTLPAGEEPEMKYGKIGKCEECGRVHQLAVNCAAVEQPPNAAEEKVRATVGGSWPESRDYVGRADWKSRALKAEDRWDRLKTWAHMWPDIQFDTLQREIAMLESAEIEEGQ